MNEIVALPPNNSGLANASSLAARLLACRTCLAPAVRLRGSQIAELLSKMLVSYLYRSLGSPRFCLTQASQALIRGDNIYIGVTVHQKTRVSPARRLCGIMPRSIRSVCASYALFGTCMTAFLEAFPIFLRAPVDEGGLGLDSTDVGLIQAVAGAAGILIVNSRLASRLPPWPREAGQDWRYEFFRCRRTSLQRLPAPCGAVA